MTMDADFTYGYAAPAVISDAFLESYFSSPTIYNLEGTLDAMTPQKPLPNFYSSTNDASNIMPSTAAHAIPQLQLPPPSTLTLSTSTSYGLYNFGTVTQDPFHFAFNTSQNIASLPRTVPALDQRWDVAHSAGTSVASSSSTPLNSPSPKAKSQQFINKKRKAIDNGNLLLQAKRKRPRVDARHGEIQKAVVYKCTLSSCILVGYETPSKRSYERHCKTETHSPQSPQDKFVCNICAKALSRSDALTRHKKGHREVSKPV